MNRRPIEPKGRPPIRNPFADGAKKKPKPKAEPKPTAEDMAAIDRANRAQEIEARERRVLTGKKPMAKGGKVMKKPVKKYAKGGSVDGCATKGKTKTKMVKMAMGGLAGRTPAGRGMMMRPQVQGGPTRATFKSGGSCGMKKGK